MAQVTFTRRAAVLSLLNGVFTIKELTDKVNTTFETRHDEWDITSLVHEFELGGLVKRLDSTFDGEVQFVVCSESAVWAEQVRTLKKAIEVEDSHRRAYWAQHS